MTPTINKFDIKTMQDAYEYILECLLATVAGLSTKKTRNKREYERHISIAQSALDWARPNGVIVSGRAEEIDGKFDGSVADWAKNMRETRAGEAI